MAVMLFMMLAVLVKNVASQDNYEETKVIEACSVGSAAENYYVRCICSQRKIYICVLKETFNESENFEINHIEDPNKITCEPNRVYEQGSMTCICNKNGTWPHIHCNEVLKSLPKEVIVNKKCKPNDYVVVDCNVCRCDANGQIDDHHCTKNKCEPIEKLDRRHSSEGNKVYGDCECGNWYSLAPCQFCYCVNSNKLICNTGTSLITNQVYLQLGAYNLHICGKTFGKELRELEDNNQGLLREGPQVISRVEPKLILTTGSKPSTSPKPFTNTYAATPNKVKKASSVSKDAVSNENVVVDNTSTESEEQEQERGVDVNNFMSVRQSTKLPNVEEYEYEASLEQQSVRQGKNIVKLDDYHEQAITQAKAKSGKRKDRYQAPTYNNDREQVVEKQTLYREGKEDSDDEPVVSGGLRIPVPKNMKIAPVEDNQAKETETPLGNLAFNMKLDLPSMLDKVFQMALRKSMVTLDPDSKCTPGSVSTLKCNTCFCMKNSKMLCTAKTCE